MRIIAWPGNALRAQNPYAYLLYNSMGADVTEYSQRALRKGPYDIFHLHWPEADLNLRSFKAALLGTTHERRRLVPVE